MPGPTRRPPKLGQHFLADRSYRERVAAAIPVKSDDLVIEIGPGEGALTHLLVERGSKVVAVEVDQDLAARLRAGFPGDPQLEILCADVLTTDLAAICRQQGTNQCVVFGNLPYYITSPILHHLFAAHSSIRAMGLMMQLEVAHRLTAQPGNRDYGYLSILTQIHSEPRRLFTIPPGAFSPPPKVQSALVDFRMSRKSPSWSDGDLGRFLEFVKTCFAHKRKNLLNNLGSQYTRERVETALGQVGSSRSARAEEFGLKEIAELWRILSGG